MVRANRRSRYLKSLRLHRHILSRRLAAAQRTEQAWEIEKAAPVRALAKRIRNGELHHDISFANLSALIRKTWPTRNKTRRGFAVWEITKSILSRSRRKLNNVVVAD